MFAEGDRHRSHGFEVVGRSARRGEACKWRLISTQNGSGDSRRPNQVIQLSKEGPVRLCTAETTGAVVVYPYGKERVEMLEAQPRRFNFGGWNNAPGSQRQESHTHLTARAHAGLFD